MQEIRKNDPGRTDADTGVEFERDTSTSVNPPLFRDVSVEKKHEGELTSWRRAAQELSGSLFDLARSDIRLAANEIKAARHSVQKHAIQMAIFSAIAAIGVLPFIAFLVVGLGDLIDNYWLSALIVSVLCFAIGGLVAYRALKNIQEQDFSMTETRRMLDRQMHSIERKLTESNQNGRRAA